MTDTYPEVPARILIVDDEILNVDLLEQELEDRGYLTETAYGGREALEKVAANPPDLILLDVIMPDIDGITVCKMLKEDPVTRLIPIVIMTALNAQEDRIRGIEAGADDFLSKPVDDRELLARINTALKTKRVVDQTVEELRSASEQLDRIGTHEEDVSVLVVEIETDPDQEGDKYTEVGQYLIERYRRSYTDILAMFSGEVSESDEKGFVAVIRSPDRETHPRLAVEAAQAIQAETRALNQNNAISQIVATIGIASGNASLGSSRIQQEGKAVWSFFVEGSVVNQAIQLAANAVRGKIAVSEVTISRSGGEFTTGEADSSLLVVVNLPDQEKKTDRMGVENDVVGVQQAPIQPGSLLWPAEYSDLADKTCASWGIENIYLHRVLSGKSGALVYAVDITARDYSGQAILKLAELEEHELGEKDEATRHRDAIETNPEYARRHLPKIVAKVEDGRKIAVLVTIAARGLEYAMPWVHSTYDVQFKTANQISRGLLDEWNADYEFAQGFIRPVDLIDSWLDYRLYPEEGGRIHELISNEANLDPSSPTFFCEGHWYPNPIALTDGIIDLPSHTAFRGVIGNQHGDFHGYNVLVGNDDGLLSYYLIDLAFYQNNIFLLFDHAYFELSHLLHQRSDVPLKDWLSLVDALERDTPPKVDDVGLVQLLGVVREEVSRWIDRHEPNRLSYLESQFMLARVGVGLNFSHKRIPFNSRLRAFLYAAKCLKSYLKFHNLEWPTHGDVLQVIDQSS